MEFSEDVDLISQKERIFKKIETLNSQIKQLNNKLKNKAYLKNAPKEIVQNDKKLVKDDGLLIIEHDKEKLFNDNNVEVRKYGAVHFSIFSF